jgi:hypothetical protein
MRMDKDKKAQLAMEARITRIFVCFLPIENHPGVLDGLNYIAAPLFCAMHIILFIISHSYRRLQSPIRPASGRRPSTQVARPDVSERPGGGPSPSEGQVEVTSGMRGVHVVILGVWLYNARDRCAGEGTGPVMHVLLGEVTCGYAQS